MMDEDYNSEAIQVLGTRDAIRKRPGMYIGSTDARGLHHIAYEIIDNSVDEALAGFCDRIEVTINRDNSMTVEDNGRGIPVDIHPKYGKPALEIVLTTLHAGGKFEGKVYRVSGGLHGVGMSVVNSLSSWLEAEIKRDGKVYFQRYEGGKPTSEIKVIGQTESTGTKMTFLPDKAIFGEETFDYEIISERLREVAFLNKGLKIELEDLRSGKREEFHYPQGIVEFVDYINRNKEGIGKTFYFEGERNEVYLELAMQYNGGYSENVYAFVNSINTIEGGTHISGFRSAITRVMNDFARSRGYIKENDEPVSGEDCREGLTAILNLKLKNPQFEGQTKTRLGNSEVRGTVDSLVSERLASFLLENPDAADLMMKKILSAVRARLAAKRARDLARKKEGSESFALSGKLAPCSSKDVELTEVFIVEGDSAGGSAKQARNREFQAILPLRGKILNVEKARIDKVLSSDEIKAMISTIGTGIGDEFDISRLRYGKIVIMTDADVDGAHIRTLLLTFFFRYMKELVERGHVYIAQPPLYRIRVGGKDRYVYSEKDLEGAKEIQRFKGLGEMNPEQLWETTMNPETRKLLRVTIQDAIEADRLFTILMGEDVEERRRFIKEHSREAINIDI
jgi:DNA gyrase subunit B